MQNKLFTSKYILNNSYFSLIKRNLKIIFFFFKSFFFCIVLLSKIRNNTYICYHHSFGHKILCLEGFIRKDFKKEKLDLINISYSKRDNKFLPLIYKNYYNILYSFHSDSLLNCEINYLVLRKIIFFYCKLQNHKIFTYENLIDDQKNHKLFNKTRFYSHEKKNITKQNQVLFFENLSQKKLNYYFPEEIKFKILKLLKKKELSIASKKVFTFSFRKMVFYNKNKKKKIKENDDYFDVLRSSFVNQKNYIKSINYLSKNKKNFLFVENLDKNFKPLINNKNNNIFFYNDSDKYYKEISIFNYFAEHTRIIQNTGGMILSKLMKTRVIISDFFPFCNGNPGGSYIIIFPSIKLKEKKLNLKKYVNSTFFFGKGFDKIDHSIIPIHENKILQVIKDEKNINKKKISFPKDSMIKYRKPIVFY